MRTVLVDYQIPDHIEFVDVFPLNDSGKTSRKALTLMFQDTLNARAAKPERAPDSQHG
jgi:non-ribosomal peptide synthetase component E (peptide arylation enzyme)